jgi:hypothetical protein
MLIWKVKENLISELSYKDSENFINPWGVETADSWSFFSLEKEIGYRYKVSNHELLTSNISLKQSMDVEFSSGSFNLVNNDQLGEHYIIRESTLEAKSNVDLMDFVQRYRFKKHFFQIAEINDQKIEHKNTNVYYQYHVKEVILHGKEFSLRISVEDVLSTSQFTPTMYVRDRGDEWIVHVRMMPTSHDLLVIKLCSRWFKTSPLPQWFSKKILKNKKIKDELLYRSEKRPYTSKIMRQIAPNAFPMVKLKTNEKLYWKSRLEIV